jgi:hypothetical protein
MAQSEKPVEGYLTNLPRTEEIRRQIAKNIRERQLLRQLLKLSEQRERVAAVVVAEAARQ